MIAGIILAAGKSSRIGKSKLKLNLGSKKIIEWVLEAAKSSSLKKIYLVIRPDDNELLEIGSKWNVETILNPDFKKGMSSSIKKALIKLSSQKKGINGFLLILGDQPFISAQIIDQLIRSYTKGKKEIIIPYFQGKRGNPVLFDIGWEGEFMGITGDVGGRVLIKSNPDKIKKVKVLDNSILFDIDKEEDYERAKNILSLKGEILNKFDVK